MLSIVVVHFAQLKDDVWRQSKFLHAGSISPILTSLALQSVIRQGRRFNGTYDTIPYNPLNMASPSVPPRPRTPREIIDIAVRENRSGEYLLYALSAVFAVVGVSVLVWASLRGNNIIALSSSIASALCWPAMNSARQTRKEGIAMRLIEIPLSRAETAEDASKLLSGFFDKLMGADYKSREDANTESKSVKARGTTTP